jgi:1-acyl-sn-glycerol-3-phosphate acyltransferase
MREAYRSGLPVLFFPEGTTTDASEILPFRRGLYHSILADDVPMNAAALSYTLDEPNPGATVANEVCFWGDMLFAPHLFRCLGLRGLRANIRFDPTRIPGADRFELAINSRLKTVELYTQLQSQQQTSPIPHGLRLDATPNPF